jgi:hypothetical protein
MIRLSCNAACLYTRINGRRNARLDNKGGLPMKRWLMKRWFLGLVVLLSPSAFAQQPVPEIPYDAVANLLKLPPDMHLGEVAGIAVNSKGHIYVYSRSARARPRRNAASQIAVRPQRRVLREISQNLAWAYAHRARRRTTTSGRPTRARTWSSSSAGGPGRDGVRAQVERPTPRRIPDATEPAAAACRRPLPAADRRDLGGQASTSATVM